MIDVRLDIKRLEKYIVEFEQEKIEKGKIMFYGDSGFTQWKPKYGHRSMEEDFRKSDGSCPIINHGFGSSTAEDLLYYYPRAVRPWEPKALVVMTYSNDMDVAYTPQEIVFLLSRLFEYARKDMPGIRLYACDARPLLLKKEDKGSWYHHQMEFCQLLEEYCDKHDDCTFICHTKSPLLYNDPKDVGNYGTIREDFFEADKVHYNQKGYDMYREFFKEALKDIL